MEELGSGWEKNKTKTKQTSFRRNAQECTIEPRICLDSAVATPAGRGGHLGARLRIDLSGASLVKSFCNVELDQDSGFKTEQYEVQEDAASSEVQLSRTRVARALRAHTAVAENLSLGPSTYVR